MTNDIKIIADPQMIPENCKFTVDCELSTGPSFRFNSPEQAVGSPLPEALFATGNIAGILVSGRIITVTQQTPEDWKIQGKRIGQAIRSAFALGMPLISEELKQKLPPSDQIKNRVLQVLETQINPAVASHGGHIKLLDVKHNDVFLKMEGGCQGCGAANITLKQGVEQTLLKEIPDLGAIYDTTDHAAGQNPYYAAS